MNIALLTSDMKFCKYVKIGKHSTISEGVSTAVGVGGISNVLSAINPHFMFAIRKIDSDIIFSRVFSSSLPLSIL